MRFASRGFSLRGTCAFLEDDYTDESFGSLIPRLHLFEIEDHGWCPGWLRAAMTGYLAVVNSRLQPYAAATEPLAELMRSSGDQKILDLCSGSGGPWPSLRDQLIKQGVNVEVRCSDRWPSALAAAWIERSHGFVFHREPVCAMAVPAELPGVRTLFTALHHFEPDEVRAMLADAQEENRHFAAFEITHRSWRGLLVTLMVPLLAFFLLPMVKPRRWVPLVLTYLPPLVPLAIGWDGFVSTLRSYRADELEAMVAPMRSDAYEWRVEERSGGSLIPMTCILGRPRRSTPTAGESSLGE